MNIVGELILSHGTIAAISDRLRSQGFSGLSVELGKAAKGMERKLNELQKGVMEVRMIPVGQLFEKMSRIVRKISASRTRRSNWFCPGPNGTGQDDSRGHRGPLDAHHPQCH